MKEKAEKSEVAEQTGEWRSTRARNDYERARRLLEEKEELRKTIKRRFKKEIGKIEKINDELQELQVQAEASSAELKTEVVAAVHERSDLTEEVGSSRGCEQGGREDILRRQVIEAEQRAGKAKAELEQKLHASSSREVELQEKLEKAMRRAQEAKEEAGSAVQEQQQQKVEADAWWQQQRGDFEREAAAWQERHSPKSIKLPPRLEHQKDQNPKRLRLIEIKTFTQKY